MQEPPKPPDEADRLASLEALELLDTPAEERFDRITRLARKALQTPIALVSLVDAERQWFKSAQGLDAMETARGISFCGHAILGDEAFVISDASQDPRFADNPLVTGGPEIRFYAGHPIRSPDGRHVGTLCVIDRQARQLATGETAALEDLAALVEGELRTQLLSETELELRRQLAAAERKAAIDSLTRLWNRGLILEILNREIERAVRLRHSLGLVMLDIDHFKDVNDRHGHVSGDAVLQAVAGRIRMSLRPYDAVGRYGGDEFLGVLADCDLEQATGVAQRMVERVGGRSVELATGELEVTASAGVMARKITGPVSVEELVAEVDAALYRAKAKGRNRVETPA